MAAHAVRAPALVVGEDHFGEVDRVLHAHATMAEGARAGVEQVPLLRVVHVDVVLVGESELDHAEHVLAARRLSEVELAHIDARPVDAVGVHLAAVVHDAQFVPGERTRRVAALAEERLVARAGPLEHGADFVLLDSGRHAPRRMEDHKLHVRAHLRRRRARLADDDLLGQDDGAVLVEARQLLRDVVADVERAEVVRHPAPALQVDLNALDRLGAGVGLARHDECRLQAPETIMLWMHAAQCGRDIAGGGEGGDDRLRLERPRLAVDHAAERRRVDAAAAGVTGVRERRETDGQFLLGLRLGRCKGGRRRWEAIDISTGQTEVCSLGQFIGRGHCGLRHTGG